MQKNLELQKTAEKTDIDGKKDEKRKSHIKEDVKTDSIGTSLHKVQNGSTRMAVNIVGDRLRKLGYVVCSSCFCARIFHAYIYKSRPVLISPIY